jgi:hypothetical protein
MQIDYDVFQRETLDAVAWVRAHTPLPQATKPSSQAHA